MKSSYFQVLGMDRPKRGDLVQSNIGDRRERTWIVIKVRAMSHKMLDGVLRQRTKIWAERWWDMEPDLRMALYRSAERNGGQLVHPYYRIKPEPKKKARYEPW